jgi:molecular chaperone Hsp33
MPGSEKETLTELDESIKSSSFFSQLHEEPLTEDNFKNLFSSIHEEIGFRSTEFEFQCNCNKDSMISFIKKLDVTELVELKKDTQVIICSHCNERYELTPKDIDPYIK